MSKVLIVGGGAAGMFAAIFAARNQNQVHVYEKNEKLGKKLFITGKGRCNMTNACDMEGLLESVQTNSKFLYSSFYGHNNFDTIDFFESIGLRTKIERGNRVFPVSDHSSDVIQALVREMNKLGVQIHLRTEVKDIVMQEGQARGIRTNKGTIIEGDAVIVATGGLSYETTGSTGDGFTFAKAMGHRVTELYPSLVPLTIKEAFATELMGLSLKNTGISVYSGKKCLYQDFGEMMFTHFGVTGPMILSASSYIGKEIKKQDLTLIVDLKPALTLEQLDQRVLKDFTSQLNKDFRNSITGLFPAKLIPVMVALSGIDPYKKVNEISKEERMNFVKLIKSLTLTITGLRGYKEAVITKGGVDIKEINPSTMESKKVQGVYFIGEVLDLDAVTGGFNLQIAWSTAYAAGTSIY
jgi:flavoprotein, HI0933 family